MWWLFLWDWFHKDTDDKFCMLLQEAENGRALSEGTVLCSQDRTPIGRIEDTFGPVMCPLYALRWAGQADMPATVAVGAAVFTTQKLAEYLLAEQLYTNVSHSLSATCFIQVRRVQEAKSCIE